MTEPDPLELDPVTQRALELLAAVDVMAVPAPAREKRSWRDPLIVAVIMMGFAVLGCAFAVVTLSNELNTSSSKRTQQFDLLTDKVSNLTSTTGALVRANGTLTHEVGDLQAKNDDLIHIILKLGGDVPKKDVNAFIASAPTRSSSPNPQQSPNPTSSPHPSSHPSPSEHPSSPPSKSPGPKSSGLVCRLAGVCVRISTPPLGLPLSLHEKATVVPALAYPLCLVLHRCPLNDQEPVLVGVDWVTCVGGDPCLARLTAN